MEHPEILICDDESGVRESLKLILERDFSLAFVTNGEEAVAHLARHAPALAILDVKMPRMGGLEALREIATRHPSLPILVISGYESADIAAQAIALGAADYLTKPFDRHVVLAKVQELAARRAH
ncbi:MAG: response regulator [Candidatus Omnitrophica bacterium]|nr:response regulator [Candidatus Omnitrophota bacterium]